MSTQPGHSSVRKRNECQRNRRCIRGLREHRAMHLPRVFSLTIR